MYSPMKNKECLILIYCLICTRAFWQKIMAELQIDDSAVWIHWVALISFGWAFWSNQNGKYKKDAKEISLNKFIC